MPDSYTLVLVLGGGGLGSLLRWQIGGMVQQRHGGPFPLGTFVVNITGCFVIGLLSTLLSIGWGERYSDGLTAFLLTGVLGGYTTFSSYELDSYLLTKGKSRVTLVAYWVGSIVAGLAFASMGHLIGDALGGAR
ncbi:MAG: CrcB family protein [Candidatus Limnocylindrales bacterium]